jgi:hypothetical protein
MIIDFPKYPFIWNYDDMYCPIDFENQLIDKSLQQKYSDSELNELISLFPSYLVFEQKQRIKKSDAKNICIHTWYLSKNKLFESNDNSVKIESESILKFKKDVFGFIYDPFDFFDKSYTLSNRKKNTPITIIKKKSGIKCNMIPLIYLHTHNIQGVFRFSPRDNSSIKFNDSNQSNNETKFYTVLEGVITINIIEFL